MALRNRSRLGLKFSAAESLDLKLTKRRWIFPPSTHTSLLNTEALGQLHLSATGPLDRLNCCHIQGSIIGALYRLSIGTPFSGDTTMDFMGKDIGLRLRKARREAGFSQVELAAKTNLKQGSISDLERGESRSMRGPTLLVISRVLGVNQEWLLTGKGIQYSIRESQTPVGNSLTSEAVKVARDWMKLTPEARDNVAGLIRTMVKTSSAETPAVPDERVEAAFGKTPHKAK